MEKINENIKKITKFEEEYVLIWDVKIFHLNFLIKFRTIPELFKRPRMLTSCINSKHSLLVLLLHLSQSHRITNKTVRRMFLTDQLYHPVGVRNFIRRILSYTSIFIYTNTYLYLQIWFVILFSSRVDNYCLIMHVWTSNTQTSKVEVLLTHHLLKIKLIK